MSERRTAIVLRALGLGDLITGLPAMRLLRVGLPDHRVLLATPRRWAPIVAVADVADGILDAHELAPIVGAPFGVDLAVDLHGNGAASRDLLTALAPRRLLAYADGPTEWRREEHEVDRWLRLVCDGLPVRETASPSVAGILGAPPAGRLPRQATVVHCGAAAASRRWPPERLTAVAMLLGAEGHAVTVTGGPGEERLAAEIGRAAEVDSRTDLSLLELMELVGHARLVVSGDTGVAHLAAAYRVPSVTLFGPVAPARWGPPRHTRHQVIWHGDDTGDPHGSQVDPALAAVTVGEAIAAAHAALTEERASVP
jgi:Glycosyltransferase family 9 (heptosyltransferase)